VEAAGTSICLVMKAVLLSGRWAGRTRRLGLEQAAKASGNGAEAQPEATGDGGRQKPTLCSPRPMAEGKVLVV